MATALTTRAAYTCWPPGIPTAGRRLDGVSGQIRHPLSARRAPRRIRCAVGGKTGVPVRRRTSFPAPGAARGRGYLSTPGPSVFGACALGEFQRGRG
jgi:hypothetical protein